MSDYVLPILIIAFLILLNAFFVAAEFAIVAVPRTRMAQAAERGSKAAQDVLQRRIISETLQRQGRVIPCHAGRLNLVLDEHGELYPCEEFSLRLGNVHDHGFDVRTTTRSAQARAVLASIARGDCWCTHECYMMTNILFSLRRYPSLLAEYFRLPRTNRG